MRWQEKCQSPPSAEAETDTLREKKEDTRKKKKAVIALA